MESEARQQSRALFRKGVTALESQRWAEARDDFAQAYKLFPHPSILLDLGVARARVGDVVEAEQDLTRFLAEDTSAIPDELQTARTTLEGVRKQLGTVRVRVAPPGSTAELDGKPIALVPGDFLSVRVTRGPHVLEASAPGYDGWSGHLSVDGPEDKIVDLTLAARPEPKPHVGLGTQRIAAITAMGVGVAVAGFAAYAGITCIDLANQYNTPGGANYQNPATKSQGIAFRTASDVTFVIAGVLVAAGIVFYLVPLRRQTPHVAVTPLGVSGSF